MLVELKIALNDFDLEPVNTYSSHSELVDAVSQMDFSADSALRYVVQETADGRLYPVFIGSEAFAVMYAGHCLVA